MKNLAKQPIARRINSNPYYSKSLLTHGPMVISSEIYDLYMSEDAPNYNDAAVMFQGWIDERNSDELRRLILRDILQQTHEPSRACGCEHTGLHACYLLDRDFDRILINGAGGIDALRQLLCLRPKLLKELTEELLYNAQMEVAIEHTIDQYKAQAYNHIILILLSVVDEETGRRLWQYCYMQTQRYQLGRLLALLQEAAQMPQWLREEVTAELAAELKKAGALAITGHEVLLQKKFDCLRVLVDEIDKDGLEKHYPYVKPTGADLTVMLRLIEENIPDIGHYLQASELMEILPQLQDSKLATKIACRHVLAYNALRVRNEDKYAYGKLQSREGVNFLYLVLGWLHYYLPSHHEAFAAVRNLLEYARGEGEDE